MSVERLFNEFTKLNRQEKKHFLDQILDSFLERKENPTNATSLTNEQIEDVKNRIASIRSRTAKTYSWEAVKSYALNKNA